MPRSASRRFQSGDPSHRATVAAGFVTGLLSGVIARGLDPSGFLAAAGLEAPVLSDRDARIPIASYVTLYNTVVRELGDEGFAIFESPLRLGTFEFLCRGMLGSADLGEALDRAARFLRLVLPELRVQLVREAARATLQISEMRPLRPLPDDPSRVFAFEWLLRLLHGVSCWIAARPIALLEVRFPFDRPHHAGDYAAIYTEHSSFGGRILAATLDARVLAYPVRRNEADLAGFLEGAPGKISMLYRRDRDATRGVRDFVASRMAASPTLEDAARALGLSPRTLHRRLHEEGTSFRQVKDTVRHEAALSRLAQGARVAEVAAELGYSEPSAFFRAFQGWTGEAPSAHRRRHRKD